MSRLTHRSLKRKRRKAKRCNTFLRLRVGLVFREKMLLVQLLHLRVKLLLISLDAIEVRIGAKE